MFSVSRWFVGNIFGYVNVGIGLNALTEDFEVF